MLLWALVIGSLAVIVWQDFRHRAIHTLIFPIAAVLLVVHSVRLGVYSNIAVMVNLAIVAVQLALLSLVMYWRRGTWLMAGERWLGWGDVVFFVILAFGFSTVNFVLFNVGSLMITLVGALLVLAAGVKLTSIPLAGCQAALLSVLLILDHRQLGRGLYTDLDFTRFIQ